MSFKPEVIADDSGGWAGNALRFATRDEAEENVANLADRWLLVRETRVVESADAVNYAWVNTRLVSVEEGSEIERFITHQPGTAFARGPLREALRLYAIVLGDENASSTTHLRILEQEGVI